MCAAKIRAKAYCIAFGCLNNNKDPTLTFFSLPKDIERREKWLKLIDREDLLQAKDMKKSSHLVCSAHFEESYMKIIKHLKDDAIPTMNLPKHAQEGSIHSETPSTCAETTSGSTETPSAFAETPSTSAETQSASTEPRSMATETPFASKETRCTSAEPATIHTKTASTYTETGPTYIKQPSTAVRTKGNVSYVIIKEDSLRTEAWSASEQAQGEDKGKVNIKRYNVQTQTDTLQTVEKKTQTIMSLTYKPPKRPRVWKAPQESNIKKPKLDHEIANKD